MTLESHLARLNQEDEEESYHGELDFKDKLKAEKQPFKVNRDAFRPGSFQKAKDKPKKEIVPLLPSPTRENLDLLAKKLSPPFDPITKNQLSICIRQNSFQWLADLAQLYSDLEIKREENQQSNEDKTEKIGCIFKSLIQMGEPNIIDAILSDKFFRTSLSALERLPELQG